MHAATFACFATRCIFYEIGAVDLSVREQSKVDISKEFTHNFYCDNFLICQPWVKARLPNSWIVGSLLTLYYCDYMV